MSQEKKTFELKDEELNKVVGGQLPVGSVFGVSESYPSNYKGEWFYDNDEPYFAYNVCNSVEYSDSFLANKYWYNGTEAWNNGTRSFGIHASHLHVIETPTTIHTELTLNKPF